MRFRIVIHLDIFLFRTDVNNSACLRLVVGLRGNDKHAVQKVNGDTVRTLVVSAPNIRDPPVRRHHHNGEVSDSSARFKNEKHSMSSMWTSSMNNTPGTISALPSSRHSATFASICSRTSLLISPVSPAKSARKP